MQEIKGSHKMHHPKYYKIILKIMLLPHTPSHPINYLPRVHGGKKKNIVNIHSMGCAVESKHLGESQRQDLCHVLGAAKSMLCTLGFYFTRLRKHTEDRKVLTLGLHVNFHSHVHAQSNQN